MGPKRGLHRGIFFPSLLQNLCLEESVRTVTIERVRRPTVTIERVRRPTVTIVCRNEVVVANTELDLLQ